MPPMIKADEADGMWRFSLLGATTSKALAIDSDANALSSEPFSGINFLLSLPADTDPTSKLSVSCEIEPLFLIVSSSATKEVVTLTRGNIAILDTWLNTAIETPTAETNIVPIWPMKAVSTREAIGSAVKASAAGRAILAISTPSSSSLKIDLLSPSNLLTKYTEQNTPLPYIITILEKIFIIFVIQCNQELGKGMKPTLTLHP
nr:hypothetical protein Iba_chr12eCG16370 [Ipomoea batatas]